MQKQTLRVVKIVKETNQASSIYFEIPEQIKDDFTFVAGQYVTIVAEISGKEYRRPYSICTPPGANEFGITVKKVAGGTVSVYLNDKTKEGDFLEVLTPMGHFIANPIHQKVRDHYFIAAGSGITPIFSMIQTILEEEPGSTCNLLYGNTDESSVIFKDALEKIAKKYSDQLFIEYVYSRPEMKRKPGLSGLFSKKESEWKGLTGRINSHILEKYLTDHPGKGDSSEYYICGPGDLIEKTLHFLESKNIQKQHIHKEYFTTPEATESKGRGQLAAKLTVTLKGETFETQVPPGKTILDVLVEMKKDPPYSCTSGACSTCIAKVTKGNVKMDTCYALEDDEVEAGYILTCQSRPNSEEIIITYDV